MKPLFLSTFLSCFAFIANAQTVTLSVFQPDPLDASLSQSSYNILLGDTLILGEDLDITGGTPPYQVQWFNNVNGKDTICNLLPVSPSDTTIFTCTVIDSLGCSLSQSILVSVIFPLEIDVFKRDISCFGANDGAISINISGGAQPFSIKWSNGEASTEIKSLTPDDYGITIIDAFNQSIDTIISVIEQAQINTFITHFICTNQTYNFNGRELNITGKYIDTLMTSNGCDSIITLNLLVNETFITTLSGAICKGKTIDFGGKELKQSGIYIDSLQSITGCDSIVILNLSVSPTFLSSVDAEICYGETYIFQGKELVETGQYTDSLQTQTGCDSILVCNLTVHDKPEKPTVEISGDTLASSGATTYQWYKENEQLNGETNQMLVIVNGGNYKVETGNEYGCTNQSDAYSVTYNVVDRLSYHGFDLKVYPCPNNGIFTVELETNQSESVQLELIAVDGKTIAHQQLVADPGKQTIPFGNENLVKGIYTLRIQSKAKTVNRKIVVN